MHWFFVSSLVISQLASNQKEKFVDKRFLAPRRSYAICLTDECDVMTSYMNTSTKYTII